MYLELVARLSQSGGYQHQIVISPNSVEVTHWIAMEFPVNNQTPSRKYISLFVHDNAHNLPTEVIPKSRSDLPARAPQAPDDGAWEAGVECHRRAGLQGRVPPLAPRGRVPLRPGAPLDEAIDFGKHHPCVIWRQTSPLGQVRYLSGLLGQDLYVEDFLPLVLQWLGRWFPAPWRGPHLLRPGRCDRQLARRPRQRGRYPSGAQVQAAVAHERE